MNYNFLATDKIKIANLLSNITVVMLFVITACFIVFYSSYNLADYYFIFFMILNVIEIVLFISAGVFMIVGLPSTAKSITFTKTIFSFSLYMLIVMFIFMFYIYRS